MKLAATTSSSRQGIKRKALLVLQQQAALF
jgi:hypothetical protein